MPQLQKFSNYILSQLPPDEIDRVATSLEAIDLPRGFEIAAFDQRIEHVYFLEGGIGSIIAVSPNGQKLEAGMFGMEAFAPLPPAAGFDHSLHEVLVQSPGRGYRIEIEMFWNLMQQCSIFRDLLVKAAYRIATQVSYTALSNAVHQVDERLARWLLMCHDRVAGDQLFLTHDYISLLLAVRRPSVTTALHVLEGSGFIKNERRMITVVDRQAMEEFARDAYGTPEKTIRKLPTRERRKPISSVPLPQ
jgi:CRP-like cAMP-binding protein